MTKLSTYQKRYGTEHKTPTKKDMLGVLVRWQRLLRPGSIVRSEIDKAFTALGYQGCFRECIDLTELLVEADNANMQSVQPASDGKEISTTNAIWLATRMS